MTPTQARPEGRISGDVAPALVTGHWAGGLAASPYGVCAHLHRIANPQERAEECRKIAEAGIGRVRFDFEWWRIQKGPGEPFDFSLYDACRTVEVCPC